MCGGRDVEDAVPQLGGEAIHARDTRQEIRGLRRCVDRDAPANIAVENDAVPAEPRCRLQDF
ncbi:hypothetical protein [uncultured Selenomonas sp.]|uniref:hypothetical protein n=1 Tax=uncultured Selenomonas sp. TaxID=159275 RepID=UPI0025ED5362|nr:hypothetical protein [uncultured Selenomonas sp.]